ncbi:MAG: cyclopropane-fatty-acyl-phospholipid synthase family protein [Vicinamibacterales bacterium]
MSVDLSAERPVVVSRWYDGVVESGLIPDAVVRAAIRRICSARLAEQAEGGVSAQQARFEQFVRTCGHSSIAVHTDAANAQHYEVPAAFYEQVLGPHLKYSSGLWTEDVHSLEDAERAMLNLTCARAQLEDGQRILELGCGWGSLTLHMARAFPKATIVAVSNSRSQKAYIDRRARQLGLGNVSVVTEDIQRFGVASELFDRVVSVEMFEHLRNHRLLFDRIAGWLRPEGVLFIHVFAHLRFAYPYELRDGADWMAQHFFTGGIMPSLSLLPRVQRGFELDMQWTEDGTHYARTAEAWLANMDAHRDAIDAVLASTYGGAEVTRWRTRWRMFFMACAELFNYERGQQWVVAHYRFRRGETR